MTWKRLGSAMIIWQQTSTQYVSGTQLHILT